jgi:hypothetical protein
VPLDAVVERRGGRREERLDEGGGRTCSLTGW